MLIVQRVVTRWSQAGRGAAAATRRRQVPTALPLPAVPDVDVVVHDVHAQESNNFRLVAQCLTGDDALLAASLDLQPRDDGAVAVRRQPFWVAYPSGLLGRQRHLFVLAPGQIG